MAIKGVKININTIKDHSQPRRIGEVKLPELFIIGKLGDGVLLCPVQKNVEFFTLPDIV